MATAPLGIFDGLDRSTLEDIRAEAIEVLRNGGRYLTQWSVAGQTFQKALAMDVREILVEVNYSLKKLDNKMRRVTGAYFV